MDEASSWHRFDAQALQGFAEALLLYSGLRAEQAERTGRANRPSEQAEQTAQIPLEADLMGHTTHGLQLLAPCLRENDAGRMRIVGR